VEAFIAAELARTAPSSAATRCRSLQQLFKWLDDEGEISGSPIVKMRPPIIPEQPVPVVSDDQVRSLLTACSGKDFRDRRDAAIIRLFLDTGMRLAW
jgi:site-specific recombinase XerD